MTDLASILVGRGMIDAATLSPLAEKYQGRELRQVLLDRRLVSEDDLARAIAEQAGRRYLDLAATQPDPTAMALVPVALCRRYRLIPIRIVDSQASPRSIGDDAGPHTKTLVVGMRDPFDIQAIDEVSSHTDMAVEPVVVTRSAMQHAFEVYLRSDDELNKISAAMMVDAASTSEADASLEGQAANAPVVRFVNLLISQAIDDRASDIHIEPGQFDLTVRFRIDGVLHEMQRADRGIQDGIISRLKIMANIDIADRRRPQDGRITFHHRDRTVDLRAATIPTVWGEKVVMRILDQNSSAVSMESLAMSADNEQRFRSAITRPHGMVLLTGPTGSGKSTSLHAALAAISTSRINVITIEDPVEYRIPGTNQIQVNHRAGLTFASSLRASLRCDPDVILVGEIRDSETAVTSIEAALTGHLVFSTLHTNDAPSAVTRLIEIGAEPYLVGSALTLAVAQRLARQLCRNCRQPIEPDLEALRSIKFPVDELNAPKLYRAVGCANCAGTGYRGRMALHEVMQVTEAVTQLAVRNAPTSEIRAVALEEGMVPLRQDGFTKAMRGMTTIEEVLRVTV